MMNPNKSYVSKRMIKEVLLYEMYNNYITITHL